MIVPNVPARRFFLSLLLLIGLLSTSPAMAYSGACRLPNGSCIVTDKYTCANQGGNYLGDNVACTAGGCRYPDGSCKSLVEKTTCTSGGGTYLGDGVSCPTGACLLQNGSCVVYNWENCKLALGAYGGDGSICVEPKLNLSHTSLTLAHPAATVQLTATLTRANGSTVSVSPTWTSSNTAVATVGPYGGVTTAGVGTATITAQFKTADGVTRSATCAIKVWALAMVVDPGMKIGTTMQARIKVFRPDGTSAFMGAQALSNWQALFETSNSSVVTIDSSGIVTGKALGKAFIRFTGKEPQSGVVMGGASYPPTGAQVNVSDGYKLRVSPASNTGYTTVKVFLTAYATGLDGTEAPTYAGKWTSSDPTIASVDASGTVTASRTGTVTVKCSLTAPDGTPLAAASTLWFTQPPPL